MAAAQSGPKNGVGCTIEQRQDIEGKLAVLTGLNPTKVCVTALAPLSYERRAVMRWARSPPMPCSAHRSPTSTGRSLCEWQGSVAQRTTIRRPQSRAGRSESNASPRGPPCRRRRVGDSACRPPPRRVYTNTTGGSSGKLGPLVGDVTQTFEGMRDLDAMGFARRGVFTNAAQFGPLRTALRARCEATAERRLSVVFEELSVSLFGVEIQKKPFPVPAPP